MMGTRVFVLPVAIVAMTLRIVPVTGHITQNHFKWQNNCDFSGGDFMSIAGTSSKCGHLCVGEAKCTHWSWTDFNGGTCWLKQTKEASISMCAGQGFCGYVTNRVSVSESTPNHEPNNPIQTEQNPVQTTDLSTSWTFSNEKGLETPELASLGNGLVIPGNTELLSSNILQVPEQIEPIFDQIKQMSTRNSKIMEQSPIQKADLPMSWTFSNEKGLETPELASLSNGLVIPGNTELLSSKTSQTPEQIEQPPDQTKQDPVPVHAQKPIPMEQTSDQTKQDPVPITPTVVQTSVPAAQPPNQTKQYPVPFTPMVNPKNNPIEIAPVPTSIPMEQNPVQNNIEQQPQQAPAAPAPTPSNNGLTAAENAEMLSSLNSYRADNGLAALSIDNRLVAAALVHSNYQATHCVMQHEGENGSSPGDRMKSQNYIWSYSAENVAAGQASVSEVMTSWWNSEHHRENILRATVTHVGFALVPNDACEYKRYWTQDFGAEQTTA